MPTTRKFAYNTGSQITGATQYGSLAIGVTLSSFSDNPGGVKWWGGPDEDLGYVIAHTVPSGNQPNPKGLSCSVGFWRTNGLNDQSFLTLVRQTTGQSFATASNAATWLNTNGYWTSYSASSNDLEAQAFITAASISDTTQQIAINQLVLDLKSYGIWNSMIAIYPFVGGSATSHKFNLKNTSSFTLSFNGGWTHNSTGSLPNGTNAYADTGISPASNLGSNHNYSVYSRTNNNNGGNTIGSYELGGYVCGENGFIADLQLYLRMGNFSLIRDQTNGNYVQFSNTSSLGHFTVNRNSTTLDVYRNGTSIGSSTGLSQALPSTTLSLSAAHVYDFDCVLDYYDTFDDRELAFASFANSSLTSTNISNLRTDVQAFQTTLGRQV